MNGHARHVAVLNGAVHTNAVVGHLTKGLARHHAQLSIRVNAALPGPIRSPRMGAMRAAVLFLLSERARLITGTVLKAEGGGPPLGSPVEVKRGPAIRC